MTTLNAGDGRVKKKLLLILLAVILTLCTAANADTGEGAQAPGEDSTAQTPQPGEATDGDADAAPQPAKAYVLVSTATQSGWLPLPEEGEISYPLRQVLPDGTEAVNTIHLTPDGVYMEDSTCQGHDCVEQGEVTLENRGERILGNMIICLPNQVCLQLYTPEEVLEMVKGMQGTGDGEP